MPYNALGKAQYPELARSALIFVPGDNDGTDCWGRYGPSTLPYSDPEERLNFERMLFFSTDRSLGRQTLKLTRQTADGYPENVRWKAGPIVYLGLNVQGSNDNYLYHDTETVAGVPVRSDAEIERQRNEEKARKAADLRWLSEGDELARLRRLLGLRQHPSQRDRLGERPNRRARPQSVRLRAADRSPQRAVAAGVRRGRQVATPSDVARLAV